MRAFLYKQVFFGSILDGATTDRGFVGGHYLGCQAGQSAAQTRWEPRKTAIVYPNRVRNANPQLLKSGTILEGRFDPLRQKAVDDIEKGTGIPVPSLLLSD